MSGLRAIICDDHRMMRESLARYLTAQPGIASVATAADVDGAIRLARRGADILVLDLRLAGDESGIEALEAMQNLHIAMPVLVMSGPEDLDLTARALTYGAVGYCPKSASPTELYDAMLQVAAGHSFIPESVIDPLLHKLIDEMRAADDAELTINTLTAREQEVLRLLGQGLRRQDIARRLELSSNTVRTHLRNIMEKLGVTNQLAAAARGRELLERMRPGPLHDAPIARVIDLTRGTHAEHPC